VQKTIFTLFLATCIIKSYGQIGINTDDPDTSAILDIRADKKGVLFPRIDPRDIDDLQKQEKDALFYYNNDTKRFYYYNASKSNWQCINPFNATGSSSITAPGNLTINDDLAVDNNLTVSNDLTINNKLSVTSILEATNDNDKIEFKKGINAENHSLEVNDATVNNNVTVESGNVDVENGNVNVTTGEVTGRGTVPVGTIVMWHGNELPNNNWRICNGKNGTPDLRNKFIQGANNYDDTGNEELIGHPTNIYTTALDGCDGSQYIFKFNQGDYYVGLDDTLNIATLERKGNNWHEVSNMAQCDDNIEIPENNNEVSVFTICYNVSMTPNEDYYLHEDNKQNCLKDGYSVLKKYKLVFIMRIK
jgi:hypothetical protein